MNLFEEATLRLKQQLKVTGDKEAAALIGLTEAAWKMRKQRESFPTKEVFALAGKRPELGLDPDWIVTGIASHAEIGARLREERTYRLKLNTKGMAELGGVTPEQQNEFEMGIKRPPADYQNRIAKAGAEIWYIMTGERAEDDPLLTPREQALIAAFRRSKTEAQNAAEEILRKGETE